MIKPIHFTPGCQIGIAVMVLRGAGVAMLHVIMMQRHWLRTVKLAAATFCRDDTFSALGPHGESGTRSMPEAATRRVLT